MMPLVYIVIVNWNSYVDTIECLKSVLNCKYDNYRIVICDNSSSDDSILHIEKWIAEFNDERKKEGLILHLNYSFCSSAKTLTLAKAHDLSLRDEYRIHIISINDNLGFTGANNQGIDLALSHKAEYVMLLNNDTIVPSNLLMKLVEVFKRDINSNLGIISPKIYFHKSNKLWFAGSQCNYFPGKFFIDGYNKVDDNITWELEKEVPYVTGCALLAKREVFQKIGYLDDDFFFLSEDVDFCLRARKAEFKIKYIPDVFIHHKVSASTGGISSPLYLYYYVRNSILVINKHVPLIYKPFFLFTLVAFTIKLILNSEKRGVPIKAVAEAINDLTKSRLGKKHAQQ
jgi:GT2 family glycosyltransferase